VRNTAQVLLLVLASLLPSNSRCHCCCQTPLQLPLLPLLQVFALCVPSPRCSTNKCQLGADRCVRVDASHDCKAVIAPQHLLTRQQRGEVRGQGGSHGAGCAGTAAAL
jgi:hypothetical protein